MPLPKIIRIASLVLFIAVNQLDVHAQTYEDSTASTLYFYGQNWLWILGALVLAVLGWSISREREKRRFHGRKSHRI